mmetsp:Transcript_5024/g.12920  ORF Transcript_5024/g.12920 Transcript_5024/m.12920 type:complete len:261 (+) Transcript_5024:754-1536(+)
MLHDGANAHVLPTAAGGAADAPRLPGAHEAVHVGPVRAAHGRLLTVAGVAWGCLLQRAQAVGTGAPAVLADPSGAPHDAVARGRTGAPLAPHVQLAVPRRLAVRVHVAVPGLAVLALGLLAARVGHRRDFALPKAGAARASGGAVRPVVPFAPSAVKAFLVAAAQVAWLHLLPVERLADLAARGGHDIDLTRALARAAVAGDAAVTPHRPRVPLAIAWAAVGVVLAVPRLPELEEAARATAAAEGHHLAVARLHAWAAAL